MELASADLNEAEKFWKPIPDIDNFRKTAENPDHVT